MIKYAMKSETGKRQNNQDSVGLISDKRHNTLAVLCDGVGGNNAGDIASKVVVNEMIEIFKKRTFIDPTINEVKQWMGMAARAAIAKVVNISKDNKYMSNMSTTLVAMFVNSEFAVFLTSGDSRAYIQTKDSFKRITRDHNVKYLGSKELRKIYPGSVLISAIGDREDILCDYISIDIDRFKKPRFLLTSDGIHDFIDKKDMSAIIKKGKVETRPAELIKKALDNKSHDNCTCLVLEVS